jgi:hypothetical protein
MDNSEYQHTTYPDFLNRVIIEGFRKLIKDTSKMIDYYEKYNYIGEAQQLKCKLAMFQKAAVVIKNYRSEIHDGRQMTGIRGIMPGIPERINMILESGYVNDYSNDELTIAYSSCPDVNHSDSNGADMYMVLDMNNIQNNETLNTVHTISKGYMNTFKSVSNNVFGGIQNNLSNSLQTLKNVTFINKNGGGYIEDEDENTYKYNTDTYINLTPGQIV